MMPFVNTDALHIVKFSEKELLKRQEVYEFLLYYQGFLHEKWSQPYIERHCVRARIRG